MPSSQSLDPDAFPVERAVLDTGLDAAFIRSGAGGRPLVLLHGYPETKRIWWRNIAPLAGRGFEVIVPDLRGFGDSGFAPDGRYDAAAMARDVHALVHGVLGHEGCTTVAGDLGGSVAVDLALRFPGFVERQVIFNAPLPALKERYRAAGIPRDPSRRERPASEYFLRQGFEADALIEELDSPAARMGYVESFYRDRGWAAPGGFSEEEAAFMAEPFADRSRLRAAWGPYEAAVGRLEAPEPPRLAEPCPVPTLAIYGEDDGVVLPSFVPKARVAFPECAGPFVLRDCGHFVQWEQADVLNTAVAYFGPGTR